MGLRFWALDLWASRLQKPRPVVARSPPQAFPLGSSGDTIPISDPRRTQRLGSRRTISGTVTLNGGGLNNATDWVGGSSAVPVTTNSSGAWSVSGLINAMYLVTATKGTYSFYPAASPVTVNFANVTNVNFQAGWAIAFQVTLGGVGLRKSR